LANKARTVDGFGGRRSIGDDVSVIFQLEANPKDLVAFPAAREQQRIVEEGDILFSIHGWGPRNLDA